MVSRYYLVVIACHDTLFYELDECLKSSVRVDEDRVSWFQFKDQSLHSYE